MKIISFFKITLIVLIAVTLLFAALSNVERVNIANVVGPTSDEDRLWQDSTIIDANYQQQTIPPYDFLVIAGYLGSEVVLRAHFAEEVLKSNDLSVAIGGRVYTFEVHKVICGEQQSGKEPTFPEAAKLSFFNEDGSGFYQPFDTKASYLLYLSPITDQKKLKEDFELDEKTTYYDPYPFDSTKRTKHRIIQLSGDLDEVSLKQLKENRRARKY